MTSLVLRLQTNLGVKRINFDSIGHSTIFDLKNKVFKETGIAPVSQEISLDKTPTAPLLNDDSQLIASFNFKRGDFIYLRNKLEFQAESSHKLTKHCQHGPQGRCLHCSGPPPGVKDTTPQKCNHGPHTTCINCSEYIREASARQKALQSASSTTLPNADGTSSSPPTVVEPIASWLCNHPRTVFCPKCIPKDDIVNAKPKIDLIPFRKYLNELSQLCKFRHGPTTTCAMCLPPPFPRYRYKMDCSRHAPYPHATCTHCAPASVVLRPQKYRHIDGISLPSHAMEYAYKIWTLENRRETNRAWLLFGRVIDEPDIKSKEHEGSRRSIVAAIYEPPQIMEHDKVTIDYDTTLPEVMELAQKFNMTIVGWLFTTSERPTNDKYGGKVLLSAHDVIAAAQLQYAYSKTLGTKHSNTGTSGDHQDNSKTTSSSTSSSKSDDYTSMYKYSEFTTVVLEHGEHIEPVAYMVSDQATSMYQDGVLQASPTDNYMLITPQPDPLPPAPIVYHDHPLDQGVEYLPDNLLVKVRTMTGGTESYLFYHYDFPSRMNDKAYISAFLEAHAAEPLHVRLSDFNLLHALKQYFAPDIFDKVCKNILQKQSFDDDLTNDVTITLLTAELLPV